MTRLIDADTFLDDVIERYCKDCDRRKEIKNGKWRIIYEIGEAPCRACSVDDMKCEIEDASTAIDLVRCKDCIKKELCSIFRDARQELGFCAWAVRKEE